MPVKFPYDPKSPPAPEPSADGASAVPSGDSEVPEILFEHSGWGLYSIAYANLKARTNLEHNLDQEVNTLTHIGCDCSFPNWHLAVYIWQDYRPEGDARFVCTDCSEIMPSDAYKMFCKVHKLLNKK